MSQDNIFAEVQDLLLGLGSKTFLLSAFPDAIRFMAMRCPVFSAVQMVSTFWAEGQFNNEFNTFIDYTTQAQNEINTNDVPLTTTRANDGHMIGAYGMFEKVRYIIEDDNAVQYTEGQFLVTGTGFNALVQGVATYVLIGKSVDVSLPLLTGVSNAVTFTLLGFPPALLPVRSAYFAALIADAGNIAPGQVRINPVGTIEVFPTPGEVETVPWTASGTKRLYPLTLNYNVINV